MQAVPLWRRAGELAVQGSANIEAITHFEKSLEELARLPEMRERDQQELTILAVLGPVLAMTRGWSMPEV